MSALVDFTTLQAIGDLRALTGRLLAPALDRLAPPPPQRQALGALVTAEHGLFASDDSLALWPLLDRLAADAAQPDAVCALANGLLMANALQGGDRAEVAGSLWSASAPRLRRLPPALRGPLARAATCTGDRHRFTAAAAPTADDRLSVDRGEISRRLIRIAQAATEAELRHIARADYGCGCDTHLPALRRVIFEQDCVFTDDQGWYPSEVVELVSHVPAQPGFAVATAILLTHCLHKGDLQANTEFRWGNNAAAYLDLPQNLRNPILAAFRAIYETDLGWAPYYSALFDPTDNRAVLLPPAAPELTRM